MTKDESQPIPILKLLSYAAAFLMAGLLLPFVWLRETQDFWTNAGGYPLWLRDLVLVAYYPLFFVYLAWLSLLSWRWICRPSRDIKRFCVEAVLLALLWAVVALVVTLMLANNLDNLMDGRPLHAH